MDNATRGNSGDGDELPYYRVKKPKALKKYKEKGFCNTCQKKHSMWSSCIKPDDENQKSKFIILGRMDYL
uniref:Uncharacterized protein n=1 Tax=Romanomermis culicivorax TaxID=13658 RepID=A0A915L4C3_ROMCU